MTTLLIIDDSRLQRLAIKAIFEPYDVTSAEAGDGEEGLAVAASVKPDLVLLDYNMPVLDGIGFLERLRKDASLAATPVIMLSANTTPALLTAAARLRVRDQLRKPIDGPTLIARVGRVIPLARRDGAAPPEGSPP